MSIGRRILPRRPLPVAPAAMPMPPEATARFARDLTALVAAPTPDRPLAIAVSGGPDSMAMLALAAATFPGCVIAATVDHRLRPAAADEAAMVARWCDANGIPHATLSPDRAPTGASIQAQARHVRYALLADRALAAGAGAIATAHHADDQAETFLMRAARGSGPAGLAGIRPRWVFEQHRWHKGYPKGGVVAAADVRPIPIVRPLLTWRRSELRSLATDLPFVDDPSNGDPRHDRTHVRALLSTGHIDPIGLAAAAAHCREADAALTETIDWLWRTRCLPAEVGECRFDPTDLPRELRRRLARRAIGDVRLVDGITEGRWSDAANIESLLDALDSSGSATQAGVSASASGAIWHFRAAPARRST